MLVALIFSITVLLLSYPTTNYFVYFHIIYIYTSQQKKRYKYFCLNIFFMLKPKQLFIIIYVNASVKRVYPHKTNNNILFRYGKIPENQFSVP
jgi:hypothetical protein